MDEQELTFIPGTQVKDDLPLSRYLPPLPPGMVSGWLRKWVSPGSWIFDPFGASPMAALEAAGEGYRVLVSCNNPILSFIYEVLASAPGKDELGAALAEISMMRHGDERLDLYLRSMYLTRCSACNQMVPAEAFFWRRGEPQPFARIYHCPHCGEEGERSLSPDDVERIGLYTSLGIHRARAIQSVDIGQDSVREGVKAALDAYLPRSLNFIFTLLNKIEGLNAKPERRRLLLALMVSVLDDANALWAYPSARSRPKQLMVPPVFRENNLWLALEEAVTMWSSQPNQVSLTHFPSLPPEQGGICLYAGRSRDLLPSLRDIKLSAAVLVIPRPNQAFWTLSAIWSGWIWGPKAVLPLKNVLERRRYDWDWHRQALHTVLEPLGGHISPEFPVFGILPELVPGFLFAVLAAAESAGLDVQALNLRDEQKLAQAEWRVNKSGRPLPHRSLEDTCREFIRAYLLQRNEPASYLEIYTAGLLSIIREGFVSTGTPQEKDLNQIHGIMEQIIADSNFLDHYREEGQGSESGYWWLANTSMSGVAPLADRIEKESLHILLNCKTITAFALEKELCSTFYGLFTPSPDFIRACLESYGEAVPDEPDNWRLRPQEQPEVRKADLKAIELLLYRLGRDLDYQCEGEMRLVWLDNNSRPSYRFFLTTSSIISQFVLDEKNNEGFTNNIIFLPGSRAKLLLYKLRHDPRLAKLLEGHWHVLKFRALRRIAERNELTRVLWEELLSSDPISWEESTQMAMFM